MLACGQVYNITKKLKIGDSSILETTRQIRTRITVSDKLKALQTSRLGLRTDAGYLTATEPHPVVIPEIGITAYRRNCCSTFKIERLTTQLIS